MYLLFASTVFLSAFLLFLIQPMTARMLLPLMGGSPAVWNTVMVFFQTALLAGYLWAHLLTRWLGRRGQIVAHLLLLCVPLLLLPPRLSSAALGDAGSDADPVFWLLGVLFTTVGLPFLVLSASAPLAQKWFAGADLSSGREPYGLYAASNLGSMLALLSYPVLFEPALRLPQQAWFWTAGYGILGLLLGACANAVWRAKATSVATQTAEANDGSPVTARRRLRWLLFALVPSSLMLGVTTYTTTDIAPIPLLWVIPLALYLLSFILVFADSTKVPHDRVAAVLPAVVLGAIILFLLGGAHPPWQLLLYHVLAFFVIALFCHGELAKDRPAVAHLTEFYLWLALGGVLGGLLNTFVAPLLVTQSSAIEYPLMLLGSLLLLSRKSDSIRDWRWWRNVGVVTAIVALELVIYLDWKPVPTLAVPAIVFLAGWCYLLLSRPRLLAVALALIVLPQAVFDLQLRTVYRERNFFGLVRVVDDPATGQRQLLHGSTLHGLQNLNPAQRRDPLSYYFPSGPLGQIFAQLNKSPSSRRVAVIGLGAGGLACYARAGDEWTFYEIDPAIERIAEHYFTFLADARNDGAKVSVVLGDGRLRLDKADASYDLIVADAFSSDSIPVHLLTREALQVYHHHLRPGGMLVFNISNRYLNVKPMLAGLAAHARPNPFVCYFRNDTTISDEEVIAGKNKSHWSVLARSDADLGELVRDPRWQSLAADKSAVWTDDFSDVLSTFKWK